MQYFKKDILKKGKKKYKLFTKYNLCKNEYCRTNEDNVITQISTK